ncbi:MAG: metal-dependent hydrolase [Candidatus Nanohaloarchaea archaeon]|nr:metal-dependent hydrolase [Candidatus Nanohaloarchaea archaeon]
MIGPTHLLFALAITRLLGLPVLYGMVGGVVPDTDILLDAGFPFTHRGIVHTPVAAVAAAAAVYLVGGRRDPAVSLGAGWLSHLFLDTFTYSGVHWLFPLRADLSFGLVGYDSVTANLGIMVLSLAAAAGWHHRRRVMRWTR